MKSLDELSATGLTWEMKGDISLLKDSDGAILGEMRRPRWFSGRTEVDAQGSRWSFERKGWHKPHIEIRSLGTGDEPARFTYKGQNGELTYPDGRVYRWRSAHWAGSKWLWLGPDEQPVLGIELTGSWKVRGEIRLDPDLPPQKAPSLLLFLGWFLVKTYQDDSTAVVVATMG
ncbi:MAG: hypothetical protein JNL34_16390 [Anaerolineae bacterium]|nr:hypothetical protein [Anaerolineae bacterium]